MIWHYTPHLSVAAVLTALGAVGKLYLGRLRDDIVAEWKIVTARLERIEDVQGVQASNHLTHIEANSEKTVEILGKLQCDAAETNGYLRAITNAYLKDISDKKI